MDSAPKLRQGPFLIGLFLVTASTLALEILNTRLLSVLTWYSLAFLVIAMGLFGLTAGALRVYFRAEEYREERLAGSLARDARHLALAIPVSYVLLLVVPLRTDPVATTVLLFLVFASAIALPFYPAGVVVAAAVTKTRFPVGRVYAVDLVGAALGAPIVPLLLSFADAGSALFLVASVCALASACFAWAGAERRQLSLGLVLAAALLTAMLVNRGTLHGLAPLWVKGRPEVRALVEQELWNSHSRVVVGPAASGPVSFWGKGVRCPHPNVVQRGIEIDGHAMTPLYHADGGLESLRFLDCDVTNVVHRVRPKGSIAIIGVGGSRDLQAALLHGHEKVVGIELNARLLEILRGPMGAPTLVPDHPAVQLVHGEARSVLARTNARFDVIQMSLIDTWAATGAGAHALGENGLYTVEAWHLFLNRLKPGGIFTVSRWATVETARLMGLAVAALQRSGVAEPHRHLALVSSGLVSSLLVSVDPLTEADSQALEAISAEKGFVVVVSPNSPSRPERLAQILDAKSPEELERITLLPELDFTPSTDDRPFFFNVVRPSALWRPPPAITQGTIEGNLVATRTLLLALLSSTLLVTGAILLPLWRRRRTLTSLGSLPDSSPEEPARPSSEATRTAAVRGAPTPLGAGRRLRLAAALGYFFCIGVGFMLAEIALLQRLSLVLGHPIYSLIVVLASLVAAAGLGSYLSDRLPLDRRPWCFVYPLMIAGLLVLVALGWGRASAGVASAELGVRVAFAVAITCPLGVAFGFAFPCGIRVVRAEFERETPWLWGLNGVGSVLASSLAIIVALAYGLTWLTLLSAGIYLLLLPALWLLTGRPAPERGTTDDVPSDGELESA
ncbi:MAG: hypothetical protein KIT72_14685 [Polyangiaceae bacterium]|nr:hypothetical protein [Polyangiaceae bacterium]MCW5791661.1 hypothetical protein [Polyangiaceae bacterium]